jgi:hypothetical protein
MAVTVLTPSMSAALERGQRALRDYQALLERGTSEDVWTDEMIRGAAVRWDILKRRALYPVKAPVTGAIYFPANAENASVWGNGTRN